MYNHTLSQKNIKTIQCFFNHFFLLRFWRAHIQSIFALAFIITSVFTWTHGCTVTLNTIVYFRRIRSYNLIICRKKSLLNHTKIMDVNTSYWLEFYRFTYLTARFAAVSKRNVHWVVLKHRLSMWTLAHFYYVDIGTHCCVCITLLQVHIVVVQN